MRGRHLIIAVALGLSAVVVITAGTMMGYFEGMFYSWGDTSGGAISSQGSSQRSPWHLKALESYRAGRISEAAGYLRDVPGLIIEPEGCELVLSIYAEAERYRDLERSAQLCLDASRARGMAAEALAMVLSSQKRTGEAIERLQPLLSEPEESPRDDEEHPRVVEQARIHAALAQLYVDLGERSQAHKHLLIALRRGEPWSLWLQRIYSSDVFYQDSDFLTQLVTILLKKDNVVRDAEMMILELLEGQKMSVQVALMKRRLNLMGPSTEGPTQHQPIRGEDDSLSHHTPSHSPEYP